MTLNARDIKMLADLRILFSELRNFHNGVNALRKRYTDEELVKYAEIEQLQDAIKKLRQVEIWLTTVTILDTGKRS